MDVSILTRAENLPVNSPGGIHRKTNMSQLRSRCGCAQKGPPISRYRSRSRRSPVREYGHRPISSLLSLAEVGPKTEVRPHGSELEWAVNCQELLPYGNAILGPTSAWDRKLGRAVNSTRRRMIYVGSDGTRKRPRLAAACTRGKPRASSRATASGRRPPEPECAAPARSTAAAGTGDAGASTAAGPSDAGASTAAAPEH